MAALEPDTGAGNQREGSPTTGRLGGIPIPFLRQAAEDSTFDGRRPGMWDRVRFLFDRMDRYDRDIGSAVEDLHNVMEWLREGGHYAQSDRLRTIAGRLARARRTNATDKPAWIVTAARKWK